MPIITPQPETKLYKQEGKTGMFQSMLWALAACKATIPPVSVSFGEYFVYFKNNYLGVYWDEVGMERVAKTVIELAPQHLPHDWQTEWDRIDTELTEAARELVNADMKAFSLEQLRMTYERLFDLDQRMWRHSIFIDTFDPGFDQARMKEIAIERGFSEEDTQVLVTPSIPAYVTEWSAAMNDLTSGKTTREQIRERFFWIETNYWAFGELSDAFIDEELAKTHEDAFVSPLDRQKEILQAHGLFENPLQTFQDLTTWRDIRKRLNYTGLYGLMKVLREALERVHIDPMFANAILPHQVHHLFDEVFTSNVVNTDVIQKQFIDGVLFHSNSDGFGKLIFGADAHATREAIETSLHKDQVTEVRGMIASPGKVIGRVCIVPHITNQNASIMQKGDILVTSMTRPEFVPLMRLAGGIVTNEGGITSHAAIISRELGKPCIIGAKNATNLLKQGDLVEVDAEKGIVRKIS